MREATCEVCGSYVHKWLSVCPACGTKRDVDDGGFEPTGSAVRGNPPETLDELWRWMGANGLAGNRAVVAAQLPEPEDPDARPVTPRLVSGLADVAVAGRATAYLLLQQLLDDLDWAAGPVGAHAGQYTFLYHGGLDSQPDPIDIHMRIDPGGALEVSESGNRRVIGRILPHQLLVVTPFDEEVPIFRSVYGLDFGSLFTFQRPTTSGGGLMFTFASEAVDFGFSVGNRSGLLSAGGSPEFYRQFAEKIAYWADCGAESREISIGSEAYGRELGFRISASTAAPTPVTSVRDSLTELQGLFDDGLITAEEYGRKRADVLDRLGR